MLANLTWLQVNRIQTVQQLLRKLSDVDAVKQRDGRSRNHANGEVWLRSAQLVKRLGEE